MNSKQNHGSQQQYQRHGNTQSNQAATGNTEQPPPTTKFVAAKLPQAPLNFDNIYKDTGPAAQGASSENKQQTKKKATLQNSPGGQKGNHQNQSQRHKNKNQAASDEQLNTQSSQQKNRTGQKAGSQLSAQKLPEESKSNSGQIKGQADEAGASTTTTGLFGGEVTSQLSQSQSHSTIPKLQTSQMTQSQTQVGQQQSAQTQREANRRSAAKIHQSGGKKQKGAVDADQPLGQHENRKPESFFSGGRHHQKRRGRVIEPTATNDPEPQASNRRNQAQGSSNTNQKQDEGVQNDQIKQLQESNKSSPDEKKAVVDDDGSVSKAEKTNESKIKDDSADKQNDIKQADVDEQAREIAASASASKTTTRDKHNSPVTPSQPQPHSYRSNSEVVQKKSRKQGASGAGAGKSRPLVPQPQPQIAELAKKLRSNAQDGSSRQINFSNLRGQANSNQSQEQMNRSNSRSGSFASKRGYKKKKNSKDKASDELHGSPKKTEQLAEEKEEEPTSKNQLKRHHVDPDAKNGGRELLVISITVKNRIIEATVRQNTDLNKLYERISLLGDFNSYPHKFKEIFFRYWKNLIHDAEALLKEEEQRDKLRKSSSKQSEDRSLNVLSAAAKPEPLHDKSKPIIEVSTLSDSEKAPGASKSTEENQTSSGFRQSLLQPGPSQQAAGFGHPLQSIPSLIQNMGSSNLGLLNSGNIDALLSQNMGKPFPGGLSPESASNEQLVQLLIQQQQRNLINNAGGFQGSGMDMSAVQHLQTLAQQLQYPAGQQNPTGDVQQQAQFVDRSGSQDKGLERKLLTGDLGDATMGQASYADRRKMSMGSSSVDDHDESAQNQQSSNLIVTKEDNSLRQKSGHKSKKIKSGKVVEYQGSSSKAAQDKQKLHDLTASSQFPSAIQVQNISVDQQQFQRQLQTDEKASLDQQLDHSKIYAQDSLSIATSQSHSQKKKRNKMTSSRKKDDKYSDKPPAEVGTVIKEEPQLEKVHVEEAPNQSLIQTDQNMSNYLKVAADQESINTANSGGGSDVQQPIAHQMPPMPYGSDPQQHLNLIAGLAQLQQSGANGASFLAGQNAAQGATNIFGQNLLNNSLQQVTAAGQSGNPHLMNFTFNNFNNHNLNGLQPQSNQQLLANQLTAATGQQMLGLNLSAQDMGQGVGSAHTGYGNAGNFVSHINTIGAIGVNINNFNNFQFNNGQLNTLPIGGQNPQQFLTDVAGNQYQGGGIPQHMAGQGPFIPQLHQQQNQANGRGFLLGAQSHQQSQEVPPGQSQQQQHASTSPTQQSLLQQQIGSAGQQQQQQNHFLQQQQMNNTGNFFQNMGGSSSQQPMRMLNSAQTGAGPLAGNQSSTSGANLPMSSSLPQQSSILSQQSTQPQTVTGLATGQSAPIMHQHLQGTSQIQGAIQNPQQYQAVQHLKQPNRSQVVSQATSNNESGTRSQGGGAPQGGQKGGAPVGSKMGSQVPGGQVHSHLNANLNLGLDSSSTNLLNTLQNQQFASQPALQLLGSPYQHMPQPPISLASATSGTHGPTNGATTGQQLPQGPGNRPQIQTMPANYVSGPPPPLPQPHLVGPLMNLPGQNSGTNCITSGNGLYLTTAAAEASARGPASAAQVSLLSAGQQQAAQTSDPQLGIMGNQMAKDGNQAAVKQGAVAAAVQMGSNTQTQSMPRSYSNRDLNASNNQYQQKRPPAGDAYHQTQGHAASQAAGGGTGTGAPQGHNQHSSQASSGPVSNQSRRGTHQAQAPTAGGRGEQQTQSKQNQAAGLGGNEQQRNNPGQTSGFGNQHQSSQANNNSRTPQSSHKSNKGRQGNHTQRAQK